MPIVSGTCVALFDQPKKPQCPNPAARRDGLCADHAAEWDRITNERWAVSLHD